jgi:tripartite-type tricarboxylate transporter receptor subunit TctC
MTWCRNWFRLAGLGVMALSLTGMVFAQMTFAQPAFAQSAGDYPNRPVTMISDAAPGSAPDIDARFTAEGLTKMWGQQVIVANHQGANGSIAARFASQAAPDGYTLFMPALSTFASLPTVAPNLPLRLPRDFLPIGFTIENPMFIAVNSALGINTLPELIEHAKKEPGSLSIAVTGVGRLTHLTGLLLQQRAGIQLVPVPYQGGPAAAMGDVGTNRVSMIIEGYSGMMGGVKAGSIKIIAVASRERLPDFPDVPTVAETIPGFFATGWQVVVAPLGTPAPIINKISADLYKEMGDPELKKKLGQIANYTRPMNPEQTLAFVNQQQETWLPILEKISVK